VGRGEPVSTAGDEAPVKQAVENNGITLDDECAAGRVACYLVSRPCGDPLAGRVPRLPNPNISAGTPCSRSGNAHPTCWVIHPPVSLWGAYEAGFPAHLSLRTSRRPTPRRETGSPRRSGPPFSGATPMAGQRTIPGPVIYQDILTFEDFKCPRGLISRDGSLLRRMFAGSD
jgi:hypothetical protein